MSHTNEIRTWLHERYEPMLCDKHFEKLVAFVEKKVSDAYRTGVRDERVGRARLTRSGARRRRAA